MIGGKREAGVLGDMEFGLDEALTEGGFAGDQGVVVILQCADDDLGGGGGTAIDQDNDGVLGALLAVGGAVYLVRERATALADDDLALLEELVGHVDGFGQQAAGVAAEVEDEALHVVVFIYGIDGVADFVAGSFDEAGDADVADAGTNVEGEVDGGAGDVVADEIEGEEFGCAFALHAYGDVGALGAFELGGDGRGVHVGGGFAVDGADDVAGRKPAL